MTTWWNGKGSKDKVCHLLDACFTTNIPLIRYLSESHPWYYKCSVFRVVNAIVNKCYEVVECITSNSFSMVIHFKLTYSLQDFFILLLVFISWISRVEPLSIHEKAIHSHCQFRRPSNKAFLEYSTVSSASGHLFCLVTWCISETVGLNCLKLSFIQSLWPRPILNYLGNNS